MTKSCSLIGGPMETPTYGFRVKFHLPAGRSFVGVQTRRRLQLGNILGRVYLVKLAQQKRNRFGTRTRYAVIGKAFPTRAAAQDVGERIQKAIALLAAERRIGVDAQNRTGSSFSQVIKDAYAAKHGAQLRDDPHGLDVYTEDRPVRRFTIEAYGSSTLNIEDYETRLRAFFEADPDLSDKERLALDLYNLSHFDGSTKTRFLTLIIVVEVLAEPQLRSQAARSLLKQLRQILDAANLCPFESSALLEGLGRLKRQSIGEACRAFVALHASTDEVTYFAKCYSARSELLHDGHTKRGEAVDPTKLDELVSHLLLRSLVGEV